MTRDEAVRYLRTRTTQHKAGTRVEVNDADLAVLREVADLLGRCPHTTRCTTCFALERQDEEDTEVRDVRVLPVWEAWKYHLPAVEDPPVAGPPRNTVEDGSPIRWTTKKS